MRTVELRRLLDGQNSLGVRFELEQGRVKKFITHLECHINGTWNPVVRYDTAHNFAHRDLIHPSGDVEKREMATQDYNEALTIAIQDLAENWGKYRERYEQCQRDVVSKNIKPRNIVEKNIALSGILMQHLLSNPELLNALPDNFELVILPEDDSAIRQYNLDLLYRYGSEGRPLIFVRMKSSQATDFDEMKPSLYVPLAA